MAREGTDNGNAESAAAGMAGEGMVEADIAPEGMVRGIDGGQAPVDKEGAPTDALHAQHGEAPLVGVEAGAGIPSAGEASAGEGSVGVENG